MHSKNVLHKDWKPSNVLLSRIPKSDVISVKVSDFGVSKIKENKLVLSKTRGGNGTIVYWPPEYLRGICGDCTDVYSFGLILFEVILKERPWSRFSDPASILSCIWTSSIWKERQNAIPIEWQPLEDLMLSCLDIDPSKRPTFKQIEFSLNEIRKEYIFKDQTVTLKPISINGKDVEEDWVHSDVEFCSKDDIDDNELPSRPINDLRISEDAHVKQELKIETISSVPSHGEQSFHDRMRDKIWKSIGNNGQGNYVLYQLFSKGEGVPRDKELSMYYLRLSADQKSPEAMLCLGGYYKGIVMKGPFQDKLAAFENSKKWLECSANIESHVQVEAQLHLGHLLFLQFHYTKPTDSTLLDQVITLYHLAADRGNATAQCYLGLIYVDDVYLKTNLTLSFKYFELSAAQKDLDGIEGLGDAYCYGKGVRIYTKHILVPRRQHSPIFALVPKVVLIERKFARTF